MATSASNCVPEAQALAGPHENLVDTLDAMADFMHGYAEHLRQVFAD